MKRSSNQLQKHAVVSQSEAKSTQYPIVFVNDDGSVRELHQSERTYLETPFDPTDGSRPYVKNSHAKKDGWGSVEGFCYRSKIPSDISIGEAPLEDPSENTKERFLAKQIKFAKENGFEVIEEADGRIITRRLKSK
jgi:hypothetical protein